jgi:hypothetical protein
MPVAIPFIAAAAGAAASAVIGGGVLGAVAAAGAALVVSAVGAAVFRPKSPSAARSANVTPGTDTGPGSGFDPRTPGAGRTPVAMEWAAAVAAFGARRCTAVTPRGRGRAPTPHR